MTATLVRKFLRDIRFALVVAALMLGGFQCLWAKVTERILGQLAPFFYTLGRLGGLDAKAIQERVFVGGPGDLVRTIIGGEQIDLASAMHLMTIGYVHPLMQTIFCIWAVGRATGAIAGEIDRGTMELLLAQPLARPRLVFAHLVLDLLTIPLLCLSLWAGTAIGTWLITPIQVEAPDLGQPLPELRYVWTWGLGPIEVRVKDTFRPPQPTPGEEVAEELREQLEIRPWDFWRGLWLVGGLMFAVSGFTMWLSARGNSRWRVLGVAVFILLAMFLINALGQLWQPLEVFRPLTFFYYYQPQQVILSDNWCVTWREWNGGEALCRVPMPLVLYGTGAAGYLLALWTFCRRDLPAPL